MPRARTQFGSASWAETESALATLMVATPLMNISGSATHRLGANAIAAVAPACSSAPLRINWSPDIHCRTRPMLSASSTAPAPIAASSSVKVPASPPGNWRASSGSSEVSAAAWKKKLEMRSRIACMRRDWRTYCTPTRIAPRKRSPGSALTLRTLRQRRMKMPETIEIAALSRNT